MDRVRLQQRQRHDLQWDHSRRCEFERRHWCAPSPDVYTDTDIHPDPGSDIHSNCDPRRYIPIAGLRTSCGETTNTNADTHRHADENARGNAHTDTYRHAGTGNSELVRYNK